VTYLSLPDLYYREIGRVENCFLQCLGRLGEASVRLLLTFKSCGSLLIFFCLDKIPPAIVSKLRGSEIRGDGLLGFVSACEPAIKRETGPSWPNKIGIRDLPSTAMMGTCFRSFFPGAVLGFCVLG